jgi:hypothetical protein
MIDRIVFSTGLSTGGAGVSTATGYSTKVSGKVLAVHVNFQGAPPAGTTDFTLSDESDPASEAIIAITDSATDIKIYPRRVTEKNDGTDILYAAGEEVYEPYVVHGRLEATIAQADDNDYADVTVWLER